MGNPSSDIGLAGKSQEGGLEREIEGVGEVAKKPRRHDIGGSVSRLLRQAADQIGVDRQPENRDEWRDLDELITRVRRLARRIERGVIIVETDGLSDDRERWDTGI